MISFFNQITEIFSQYKENFNLFFGFSSGFVLAFINFLFYLIFAWLFFKFVKTIINMIIKIVEKSVNKIDDLIFNVKFRFWIPHLATSLVLYFLIINLNSDLILDKIMSMFIYAYMVISILNCVNALIDTAFELYSKLNIPDNYNFKGIIQSIKIIMYLIAIIFIVSNFIGESPWKLLSGLGALTAIMLLIFKDPIMGLVAGIQLFANNMIKVGDWIEMQSDNVDGNIVDISLTSIKVQNFDKTIVYLPTHSLVTKPLKNWRGMQEAGGRRIKRNFSIDAQSVKFLTEDELVTMKKHPLFKEISHEDFTNEILASGQEKSVTNLGIFRNYIKYYLNHHPAINRDLTLIVHELNPTAKGIPLQLYCFTNSTDWIFYEDTQSAIFEHLVAIASDFKVKVFQDPSGLDFSRYLENN